MAPSQIQAVTLACHPDTRSAAVRSVAARVRRTPDAGLTVTYVLEAMLERLRIPPPRPPRIGERLWQHSCCELFIGRKGLPAYVEFNFSPSGEWAVYAFRRYRDAAPLEDRALQPQIALRRAADRLELEATIRLLAPYRDEKLALGLAVVAEEDNGALSYWAIRHAPGKPDFHHPDAFALELDEVRD
jgi:hypothetical protein